MLPRDPVPHVAVRLPGVTGVGSKGAPVILGGTSAAAPFVTGAIALLWSEFPTATAAELKFAVTQAHGSRRGIVPPLLDAWTAYAALARARGRS
jgi:subtilisin family serine protease